jgi:uncharacterized protein
MRYEFPDSVILIFCKAPVAGYVKTRLQAQLGAGQAVAAHLQLTQWTLARTFQLALCQVQLYCAPDIHHAFFKECRDAYALTLMTQQGGDLGHKMLNAFSAALSHYRQAILIGSDCPSFTAVDLREALLALQNGADVVLAPAEDGGYVLIGLSRPEQILFENIDWGTEHVFQQTLHRCKQAELHTHELTMQWDVDTLADWERFLKADFIL